jgi:RNA polymerase-binding transcription factor DksA
MNSLQSGINDGAEALTEAEIAVFKVVLEKQRAILAQNMRTDFSNRGSTEGENTFQSHEITDDDAIVSVLNDNAVREMLDDAQALNAVDEALHRILEGNFGTCTSCKEPINKGRLYVSPTASLCMTCQEEKERGQRHSTL